MENNLVLILMRIFIMTIVCSGKVHNIFIILRYTKHKNRKLIMFLYKAKEKRR